MIKCFDSNITEQDKKNVLSTLDTRVLAFGPNVEEFESRYSYFSKKKYNIGFNSASSAAYLLYQYLYEKHGKCRVYTTSLGFVSPVFAAIKNNHEVVYVDVDDNLLMSTERLQEVFIEDGTVSVVMPVLYGGVSKIEDLEEFSCWIQHTA
jgi:dTDP-4-amino-4,6-dideoxygalactose transaminase